MWDMRFNRKIFSDEAYFWLNVYINNRINE